MKSIRNKLMIIIALSLSIMGGLVYLIINDTKSSPVIVNTPSPSIEPTVSPSIDPTSSPTVSPVPTSSPLPNTLSIDVENNDSITRMINLTYRVDESYVPNNLVHSSLGEKEIYLQDICEDALNQLFQSAKQDGISLNLISGYRSYDFQNDLYEYYVSEYGIEEASLIDCHPGASEHQIGLAVDLGTSDHQYDLDERFETTDAYQWLEQNCVKYGFILRYPKGKESITNIMYSPWHFRYVGIDLAKVLYDQNLTMEEYYDSLNS